MKKQGSKKIREWTNRDRLANAAVYVANLLIIAGLFLLGLYLNPAADFGVKLNEFFASVDKPIIYFIAIAVTSAAVFLYFYIADRDFLKRASNAEMIFLLIEFALIISYAIARFVNPYLRPFALVPLIMLFLTNKKSAMFAHAIFCVFMLLINVGTSADEREYIYLLLSFAVGVLAVVALGEKYSRLKLLSRSFYISAPTFLMVGVSVLAGGITDKIWQSLVSAVFCGPFTVALFILFMPFFEGVFKKISAFRLAEFTDHRAKLIRRMIMAAPGTFNHAIVVSNLAEACATAIEEDALMARTCAYYHDIGKLRRPEFFSENQADGVNPHNDLTPELSTNIIRAHAQDGYNLALKHRLPKEIADVCLQHHGTLPIYYFYYKAKKFTDGEVDIKEYCYAGPKPQSKIAAIIMIADGCEAASRTLTNRSTENVRKVVTKIVNERMALGQFDECEITIKELNIIIQTIVNNLTGVYHQRVKYPSATLSGVKTEHPSGAVTGEEVAVELDQDIDGTEEELFAAKPKKAETKKTKAETAEKEETEAEEKPVKEVKIKKEKTTKAKETKEDKE